MIKKSLTTVIACGIVTSSIVVSNPMIANAESRISIDQAKNLIVTQGDVFDFGVDLNELKFINEISVKTDKYGCYVYKLTDNRENLYIFQYGGMSYYIGVNSGKIYASEGGAKRQSFACVENNNITHHWYIHDELKSWIECNGWNEEWGGQGWYYYNNGIQQKGWQLVDGNWYYFNKYGKMRSNTVIDGYKLGASGAWIG